MQVTALSPPDTLAALTHPMRRPHSSWAHRVDAGGAILVRLLELKAEVDKAYRPGDKIGMQRVMLKRRLVYEVSGVSMLPMVLVPFVQLPGTLGMFFGVKLSTLPLEQLHRSGV